MANLSVGVYYRKLHVVDFELPKADNANWASRQFLCGVIAHSGSFFTGQTLSDVFDFMPSYQDPKKRCTKCFKRLDQRTVRG